MGSKPRPLRFDLVEEGARRLSALAAVVAVVGVAGVPLLDDPVSRLAALPALLLAGALVAFHRYQVVRPRTLLALGMAFEVAVAMAISMIETPRPLDPAVPLFGVSAVGPWIIFLAAAIPARPEARLGLALAAAATWPVAYLISANRLGFVTESWGQAAIWPAANGLCALAACQVARWLYGTPRAAGEGGQFGSYQLIAPLAEGGMGEVWRARHRLLARPAAIKIVKPDAGAREMIEERFRREAHAIAGLSSPHTVYLYDFGTTGDGRLYYVMELLDGISLHTLVTRFGPQPPPRIVSILRQMCRSLEEAHQAKIVHRDLKPSNVMICRLAGMFDVVKILDFGLAKPLGGTDIVRLTAEGVMPGTPEYMAPEVALGNPAIDGRADLYALGCVGYLMLTGQPVFSDPSPVNLALKHVQEPALPPSARTDRPVPRDLEGVLLACLEKTPDARPASAKVVERMLAACQIPAWSDEDAAAWWAHHLPKESEHAPV